MKIHLIWLSTFVVICLSSASFKLDLTDKQFTLKSSNENSLDSNLYQPLKIHTRLIEESFSNSEINKALSSILASSSEILSDLLLTKSPNQKIRTGEKIIPGEKISCGDAFLTQIIQNENIDADIAIFAASSLEGDKIIASTKCEDINSSFIKAIVLEINVEEFTKLEKISQIKEICIEISKVLHKNNEEERKIFANEIDEYLNKNKNLEGTSCIAGQEHCIKCQNSLTCSVCDKGYFPQIEHCTGCPDPTSTYCAQCGSQCATCSFDSNSCTKCIDSVHMSSAPTCTCPDNSVLKGVNCVCNKGYYFSSDTVCSSCASNCATCSGSYKNCIKCSDPLHMSAAPACACPQNTHILAGRCVSDS